MLKRTPSLEPSYEPSLTGRKTPHQTGDVVKFNTASTDGVKVLSGLKEIVMDMRVKTERWREDEPMPTDFDVQNTMDSIAGGVRMRFLMFEVPITRTMRNGGVILDLEWN